MRQSGRKQFFRNQTYYLLLISIINNNCIVCARLHDNTVILLWCLNIIKIINI